MGARNPPSCWASGSSYWPIWLPIAPTFVAACSGCSNVGMRSGWLLLLSERAAARGRGIDPSAADLHVLAPIRHPRAVFCALFNYADMLDELGLPRPSRSEARPYLVPKLPNCIIGPDEAILLPTTERVDWGSSWPS